MKKIILLFAVLGFSNCNSNHEFKGQFPSSIDINCLNADNKSIEFDVHYSVKFIETKKQRCAVDTKKELNEEFIQPTIRDVVIKFVRQLDTLEMVEIDNEKLRVKVNNAFAEFNNSLNTSIMVDCHLTISMLSIERKSYTQ